MLQQIPKEQSVFGRGVYGIGEGVRLLNFHRHDAAADKRVTPRTISRWLRGHDYRVGDEVRHAEPLWNPDYTSEDGLLELSFRDLIELRFVKAFRDQGLGLTAIRECFQRAVEEVQDQRPFSTKRFRTDGNTIFLDVTHAVSEGELIDLKHRQRVFRTIIEPSLRDLEFDADAVARWYPLGASRRSVVIDPRRAFGRPLVEGGVPTEVLAIAVQVEGSVDSVARLYEVAPSAVRDAMEFERKLAA